MRKCIFIAIVLLLLTPALYFFRLFYNSEGNNISILITNDSRHDSIYIEGYCDQNRIFSDYFLCANWYEHYYFRTSIGKHTLTLKAFDAEGLVEKKQIDMWVLPLRYIVIDYYGRDFYEWKHEESGFVVDSSPTPGMLASCLPSLTVPLDTRIGDVGKGTTAHEFGYLAGLEHPSGLMMIQPGGISWMTSAKKTTNQKQYEENMRRRGY